jgi:putative transposase
MKKPRYTDQQIAQALRQAEQGTVVAELCCKLGVSETPFYHWKKVRGHGGGRAPACQAALGEESPAQAGVADLTLDKAMLPDVLPKRPRRAQRREMAREGSHAGPVGATRRDLAGAT